MTPRPMIIALAALLLSACSKPDAGLPTTATAPATSPATLPAGPRIVSTVPAATLNLVLLHAADQIVGVSKYDQVFLPEEKQNLPIVGDYLTMNYETLIALHPTAIVVQDAEARIPARLREVADKYHFDIVNIKLDTVDDIWGTVITLGKISGHEGDATKAVADAREKMHLLEIAVKNRHHPKVVYILERSPMSIAGGGTFLGQMIELAGGTNAGATLRGLYPDISKETLVNLAPDVLLVSAPSQPPQEESDPRLAEFTSLPIPAAWNNRIYLVTDGNAMVASLELPNQIQQLAAMIHKGEPSAAGPSPPATEGKP